MKRIIALMIFMLAATAYCGFIVGLNVGYDRGRDDEQSSRACPCDQCDCGPPMGAQGERGAD